MPASDAARIFSLNTQLSVDLLAEATPAIEALRLEPKAFFVLNAIEDYPSPAALAHRLSMPRPTITSYLKALAGRGFIHRELDPSDLRRHRLVLTASGKRTLSKARDALAASYDRRLARLTADEAATFAVLLDKLTQDG